MTPPPTPKPEPTVPPNLDRRATVTRDDIRVTVTLQRNPLPAGELSWVKTRVENLGSTDVTWFHNGCATSVGVGGQMAAWRYGATHEGQAQRFKNRLLGVDVPEDVPRRPSIGFSPKEALGRGSYGCADVGITDTIKPGRSIRDTRWWSGFETVTGAPVLTGPVTLRINAGYYWRGAEPPEITDARIQMTLDTWIVSDADPVRPTPPEIVDAALSDAGFATYLHTQKIGSGRAEILWYRADEDVWEVGVMPWYETDPPRIHGVVVDAETGEKLGPLDRPWIEDVDPAPY